MNVPLLRGNERRLWRHRIYAILILTLVGLAFFITWKQMPNQCNDGGKFHLITNQTDTAAVTLVHAEDSYSKENGIGLNNSRNTSSSVHPSTPSPSTPKSPDVSPAVSSLPLSSSSNSSISPSPLPARTRPTEQELAYRQALTESSRNALLGLNDCPHCSSVGEDKTIDEGFFEKFGALEVGRRQCLRDIRDRIVEDFRPLFANIDRVVLVDVALHTNMGDSILWKAAIHLTSLFGHSVNHVCEASQGGANLYESMSQFPHCDLKNIVDLVKDNGLILYSPGGNWGDLYRFIQQYRMKAFQVFANASREPDHNFKVVQLPQTIHYKLKDNAPLDDDDNLMHSLPTDFFTLFVRQNDSFEFANEHYGQNIKKVLTADLAFVLGDLLPIGEPEVDILVLIRADGEITKEDNAEKELVKQFLRISNVTFSFQDWWYHAKYTELSASNPTILSEVRLNEAIKIISKGQIVITNRMHGSVMATLVGRTLLWVDTTQKKVAGVRRTAFNMSSYCTDENLRSFEFPSILEAAHAAVEYLSVRPSIESLT